MDGRKSIDVRLAKIRQAYPDPVAGFFGVVLEKESQFFWKILQKNLPGTKLLNNVSLTLARFYDISVFLAAARFGLL